MSNSPSAEQTRDGSGLGADREWIDECYVGDDAAAILTRLRESSHPRARAAADDLAARSPYSVALTLAALRRAADLDLADVLRQDARLVRHVLRRPDFAEGVRARLVDKDGTPRWEHASLADVPRRLVEEALAEH